jgi:hypothetical protein
MQRNQKKKLKKPKSKDKQVKNWHRVKEERKNKKYEVGAVE